MWHRRRCGLHRNGRFVGAWTPRHYDDLATKVETYNKYANAGAAMIPRERQREIQRDNGRAAQKQGAAAASMTARHAFFPRNQPAHPFHRMRP